MNKTVTLVANIKLADIESLIFQPDLNTFEGLRDASMIHMAIGVDISLTAISGLRESDIRVVSHKGDQTMIASDRGRLLPLTHELRIIVSAYVKHEKYQQIDRSTENNNERLLFPRSVNVLDVLARYGCELRLHPPEFTEPDIDNETRERLLGEETHR